MSIGVPQGTALISEAELARLRKVEAAARELVEHLHPEWFCRGRCTCCGWLGPWEDLGIETAESPGYKISHALRDALGEGE